MLKYRDKINSGVYLYGTEIEFINASLRKLDEIFKEKGLPVIYNLGHKNGDCTYDKWILDEDRTVSSYKFADFLGGEISSKILRDDLSDWLELKSICEVLRDNGAEANTLCSNHITVSLASIKNKQYFFEVLAKLIALYEREISVFYMGDSYLERTTMNEYAKLMEFPLMKKVNYIDTNDKDYLMKLQYYRDSVFGLRDAISLYKYTADKLIEIRYPNGTLNEITIQNNILFTLRLIDAIVNEKFDLYDLTKLIDKKSENYTWSNKLREPICSDFENIASRIAVKKDENDAFMEQYENVLKLK